MTIKKLLLITILVLTLFAAGASAAEQTYVPGELFVKFEEGVNYTGIVEIIEDYSDLAPGLLLVKTPDGKTVEEAVTWYSSIDGVEYAEPNYVVTIPDPEPATDIQLASVTDYNIAQLSPSSTTASTSTSSEKRPNDEYYYVTLNNGQTYSGIWGLENIGQVTTDVNGNIWWYSSSTKGADISAPKAWAVTTGSKDVIVAVVDTGVNYNHEDIKANMWTDSSGHYGYDFVNNDNDPMDDYGHGTHVAGTIGAVGNNGTGIAGVAWNVKIMAVKVMGSDGRGDTNTIVKGIQYAIQNKARIINLSLGGTGSASKSVYSSVISKNPNVVFVCAAGNDSANTDVTPHYPSSLTTQYSNVISVAATNYYDNLASFSNYGTKTVDVAAPGESVLSLYYASNTAYCFDSGTSMAAPMVSGVAALMLSVNKDLSAKQVVSIIRDTVDKKSSLSGKVSTGGRVNAYAAVVKAKSTQPEDIKVTGIKLSGTAAVAAGAATQITATVTPANATNKTVTWSSSDTKIATVDANGKVTGVKAGKVTITATAKDGSGVKGTISVTVTAPVKVTSVKVTGTSTVNVGSTVKLTATVSPSTATNKEVTWKSSNTAVATVDANGNVKGIKAGTATITATAKDGSKKSGTLKVTVKKS